MASQTDRTRVKQGTFRTLKLTWIDVASETLNRFASNKAWSVWSAMTEFEVSARVLGLFVVHVVCLSILLALIAKQKNIAKILK